MSVAFKSKSGEFGGDDWNQMAADERSKYGWRSQSSVWWIGAAAVCLGLLLLTVILVAHNTSAISHLDTKCVDRVYNLANDRDALRDERDQLQIHSKNLTNERDALRDERDQLQIHSNNLTKEMEVLQSQYSTVAAIRDKLQEDLNRLNLSIIGKPCHQGWTKFNNKCYYVSPNEVYKTWENSRKDCRERGADLVIITTKDELNFVTVTYDTPWIGLSRKQGKWMWMDGTDLVATGFWQNGEPNNNGGNEDCVEVSRGRGWNDVSCDKKLPWVCED